LPYWRAPAVRSQASEHDRVSWPTLWCRSVRVLPASRVDHLSDADALASLNSVPQGLSSAEARRRLLEFGPNHVE